MVEIFKTDVQHRIKSEKILAKLNKSFPAYTINFDLDDCDKILRVESNNGSIDIESILTIVHESRAEIELILD